LLLFIIGLELLSRNSIPHLINSKPVSATTINRGPGRGKEYPHFFRPAVSEERESVFLSYWYAIDLGGKNKGIIGG